MLKFLIKKCIPDSENVSDSKVRSAYGTLCGFYGIFINLVLFAAKFFAGTLSGSVAITADAFNNLSDAGSSIITLLGFAIAGRKPDPSHPFGHGRVEYLTGLIISALIILMGFELGKSSVEKIINPVPIEAGIIPAVILVLSIAAKFYMSLYNRRIGRKINSTAMQATATDSLSDSISTAVVLVSMLLAWIFGINIDGWAGLAVAVFICFAGVSAIRETLAPLLGQPPEKEFVEDIERTVLAHPEIIDIHDLIVHDYGPGRMFISLHAEVDGYGNLFELHDIIDNTEFELNSKFGCLATIHLDPVDVHNEKLFELRSSVSQEVKELLGDEITIHDFRMVPGPTHTNLIFDAVIPAGYKMTKEEASAAIKTMVHEKHADCFAVVNIDTAFV